MPNGFMNACVLFVSACVMFLSIGPVLFAASAVGAVWSGYLLITIPVHAICEFAGIVGFDERQMVAISLAIAACFGFLAYHKGKSFFKWFFVSLLFSVPAWVYIILFMRKTEKLSSGDLIKAGNNMRDLQHKPGKDFKDFKDI